MVEKIKYPSINAKLKGMYSKILSKEDLEELQKQKTIKDAIIFLNSKTKKLEDISINAKRIELESKLDNLIIEDIKKIYRVLDKKSRVVLDAYILKYKLKILRVIWKDISIGKQVSNALEFVNWSELFYDIKGIENVANEEEFLEKIKDQKLKEIFKNNSNLFELESMISKYYFENLYNISKIQSKTLNNIVSYEIDLINVLAVYRCKKYYGFYDDKFFINYGKYFKKNKILDISKAEAIQDAKDLLKNAKYKELIEISLGENRTQFIYKKFKQCFRQKQFDIATVIAYLYIKEVEQAQVVTIIEEIRYGLQNGYSSLSSTL